MEPHGEGKHIRACLTRGSAVWALLGLQGNVRLELKPLTWTEIKHTKGTTQPLGQVTRADLELFFLHLCISVEAVDSGGHELPTAV